MYSTLGRKCSVLASHEPTKYLRDLNVCEKLNYGWQYLTTRF